MLRPYDNIQFTKQPYFEDNEPRRIDSIKFSMFSASEIGKISEVEVFKGLYYDAQKRPIANGLLDPKMGPPNKSSGLCATCHAKFEDCPGHYGCLTLALPVFNIGYIGAILDVLKCICKSCSHILLPEQERKDCLKKMRNTKLDSLQKTDLRKKIIKKLSTKVEVQCLRCGSLNGKVKKGKTALQIVHSRPKQDKNQEDNGYSSPLINPHDALLLFNQMLDQDCELLYLNNRPENLIITNISVPPLALRPSVFVDGGIQSNENDITERLKRIIQANACLHQGLQEPSSSSKILDDWDYLQVEVAQYINSDVRVALQSQQPTKPLSGFVQRLKGKQGRFRGNLSGKRVEFTGRTVISPDPNLKITEVAVPLLMASILTYPECVNHHNIEKLRQCVRNGPKKYPGAKFVVEPNGDTKDLSFSARKRIADELKFGYIVHRHLEDGDVVLFNRQPSLHRMSIMCHRARIMPWRTLRFNESVCNPYNADFDGDEMNMHVPQTQEARAEALLLMGPVELWTGKQLFNVLLRPNAQLKVFVNLMVKEKIYRKIEDRMTLYCKEETMCPNDGFVYFRNSELMSGQLGKTTLGNGNKVGLFSVLVRDYNAHAAAACMNRLAKLSARWIGNHGFSIGIDDVQPGKELAEQKHSDIVKGYKTCDELIKSFNEGELACMPGCDASQTLEAKITQVLNEIREIAGKVCMKELHWRNSPLIMSQCGSKGSPINISQMVACVGQQAVGGRRAPDGFIDRSLPHFPRNSKTPEAKGFVANSFYSGLTATEFFFHTMGGREGLVDTAVKTADTGYMSRRLMKCLEDLAVHYDMTVRNSNGTIVQFFYGDDGMDPAQMEGAEGFPLDFERLRFKVEATCPARGNMNLSHTVISDIINKRLSDYDMSTGGGCSGAFKMKLLDFFNKLSERKCYVSEQQLQVFLDACISRLRLKRIEAGTAIGAIGAQSIGEPGTQMTLKTFHFAGVASMNVTLGVPRIKEIMNASKKISTPIIMAKLENDTSMEIAETVKGQIEKTLLGQKSESSGLLLDNGVARIRLLSSLVKELWISSVFYSPHSAFNRSQTCKFMLQSLYTLCALVCFLILSSNSAKIPRRSPKELSTPTSLVAKSIKLVMTSIRASVVVKLDMKKINALRLCINAYTVKDNIERSLAKRKNDKLNVKVLDDVKLAVMPDCDRHTAHFVLHRLKNKLSTIVVKGIDTVERAIIADVEGQKGKLNLIVEGTGLREVMGIQGVDGCKTESNHIIEVQQTLGIEAARSSIIREINKVMQSHSMDVDIRHMMLLADVMTFKGEVLAVTRVGIAKMKESILMLASFEKTADHLFNGSVNGREEKIEGVSECIIMGVPMQIGTGILKIMQRNDSLPALNYASDPIVS
uniref:DNA-directed RNA polymerase subunit n=1 Tax=Chenopodium quinoa TaxID=63459 RepID=A0A803L3S3_CHEQI